MLVADRLQGGHRDDLRLEQARLLRRGRALLGAQGVAVLVLAADAVEPRHVFGGLQHRHVGVRGVAGDVVVALAQRPLEVARLHGADVLLAGADGDLHAVDDDLLGGGGDGHQPRGALAVEGLAADRHRQAGGQGAHAAEVPAGGAGGQRGAHHQVLDLAGVDAGARHRRLDGVGGQAGRAGVVEGAAEGLADGRAGGGEDDGFFHGGDLLSGGEGRDAQQVSMRVLPAATRRSSRGAGCSHIAP
ncbi:hypothetical protein D3C85_1197730 [compost metagenome]